MLKPYSPSLDVFQEHLKLRVPAVQESIKRARFAFLLCFLASLASFLCLWNTYLSFNRDFVFSPMPLGFHSYQAQVPSKDYSDKERREIAEQEMRSELLKNEARSWVEAESVTINLLGIRIGVCDFAVLDSVGLYLFVYYCLMSVRRENRELGQLLTDIRNSVIDIEPDKLNAMGYSAYGAYAALNAYMVFNINRKDDSPIRSVTQQEAERKIPLIRNIFGLMIWMPLFVVCFIVVSDLSSIWSTSIVAFRSPFRNLAEHLASNPSRTIYVAIIEIFAIAVGVLIYRLIRESLEYDNATRAVLESFRRFLFEKGFIPRYAAES